MLFDRECKLWSIELINPNMAGSWALANTKWEGGDSKLHFFHVLEKYPKDICTMLERNRWFSEVYLSHNHVAKQWVKFVVNARSLELLLYKAVPRTQNFNMRKMRNNLSTFKDPAHSERLTPMTYVQEKSGVLELRILSRPLDYLIVKNPYPLPITVCVGHTSKKGSFQPAFC